jgi:hypothetical protein
MPFLRVLITCVIRLMEGLVGPRLAVPPREACVPSEGGLLPHC